MFRGPAGANRTVTPPGAPGADRRTRSAVVPKFVTRNGRFADPEGAMENVVTAFVERATRYWLVGPMSADTTSANRAGVGTAHPVTETDHVPAVGVCTSTCSTLFTWSHPFPSVSHVVFPAPQLGPGTALAPP